MCGGGIKLKYCAQSFKIDVLNPFQGVFLKKIPFIVFQNTEITQKVAFKKTEMRDNDKKISLIVI